MFGSLNVEVTSDASYGHGSISQGHATNYITVNSL